MKMVKNQMKNQMSGPVAPRRRARRTRWIRSELFGSRGSGGSGQGCLDQVDQVDLVDLHRALKIYRSAHACALKVWSRTCFRAFGWNPEFHPGAGTTGA